MRRFFERGDPDPDEPEPQEQQRSEEWHVPLTPARPTVRPEDTPPESSPMASPPTPSPPGATAVAERLDVLSARLDGLTMASSQQRTTTEEVLTRLDRSVAKLERDFGSLSADLAGISHRLNAVLGQLVDYDLRAASESLAQGIEEVRRHLAERDAALEGARKGIQEQVASALDSSVGMTNERLDDLRIELERLGKELALLRRRITLSAK